MVTADQSAYTQGPWKVTWPGPVPYIQCPTEGCFVAACFTVRDQTEANARLLAAAPDLLRALIDLGDWLAYGLNKADGAEPTAEDMQACERVAAQARAAIKKATGNE